MLSHDIDLIDDLTLAFKLRAKEKGHLNIDIRFVLLLDIIRFELVTTGKISDITAGAVNSLFVFQAHEFFYRDFPDLYGKCSSVNGMLANYNKKYKAYDNLPLPGTDDEKWVKYFCLAVSPLLKNNKPSITELDAANTGF